MTTEIRYSVQDFKRYVHKARRATLKALHEDNIPAPMFYLVLPRPVHEWLRRADTGAIFRGWGLMILTDELRELRFLQVTGMQENRVYVCAHDHPYAGWFDPYAPPATLAGFNVIRPVLRTPTRNRVRVLRSVTGV